MSFNSGVKLNSKQQRAVCHEQGPLLIIAGAGTGKTSVLVSRLAYLVEQAKVSSNEVLLLTFTEKAASEMEERAQQILPYGCLDLWISTFHSFGERILRESGLDIGLSANFKLLSETDQWILIKKNLSRFQLDYYRPLGNPSKFISELIKHFSRLKDENISAVDYLDYVENLEASRGASLSGDSSQSGKKIKLKNKVVKKTLSKKQIPSFSDAETEGEKLEIERTRELAAAYHTYNQLLLENNFLDFGDLILYTLKLLTERPNLRQLYRQKFKYIMVDEFQDTNWAQYELVKILAAPTNNLVVVGDDDQAIYKFRGASLSNIMQFKDDYPEAAEVVLLENYRSRQEILDCAYRLIQHNNPERLEVKLNLDKHLVAKGALVQEEFPEPAVQYFNFDSRTAEISYVGQKIEDLYREESKSSSTFSWSDFAILVRANETAEAYVKELSRRGIPNLFMSWRGLYYKPIILDVLAYFRLLDNYHESSALFRVLSMDIFKVEHADLITINKMAARKVWSLYEALKNIKVIHGLSAKSVANASKLLKLLDEQSRLVASSKTSKLFLNFAYDSGLLKNLDRDRDLEIFSYLNQFYQKIKSMEEMEADLSLADCLEAINLELEAGETGALKLDFADSDAVKIMTVHGAKGLEFKYVFVVGLVDKRFPTISRSEKISLPDALVREQIDQKRERAGIHLAEERRLFYVALTRARVGLYLTGAKDYGGVREKKPSRFIEEAGLVNALMPEIVLSEKNEFLRDVHYMNAKELAMSRAPSSELDSYPVPDKFSFSQLAAYSVCPLQYKFAFILKVPVPRDKASLIFGRVLHNVLYNFLLPLLHGGQGDLFAESARLVTDPINKGMPDKKVLALISESRIMELYQEFWQNDGYTSQEERAAYKIKGQRILKDFLATHQASSHPKIMFLEKKFSFKLGADIIKGTIDRVDKLADGSLEIIDYKTGASKDKLEFKDKRQLILYQLFLEEFLRTKVSLLSYYYLEDGRKRSFVATDKDFVKLKDEVVAQIAAIKMGSFEPTPGDMCRYCDFRNICEFRHI